jgi:tetratricopeptide (TPR) repeat protein
MVARDAQTTIGAALESVRTIADEIVVVDTGSTDHTKEIARQRASRILECRWNDDFSAARNFALQQLTGDWVLWLDASEQLDTEAAQAIRRHIDSQPTAACAYLILVQLPAAAGQADGEQIGRIRLWPLKSGLKYAGRVREQLSPGIAAAGLSQEITSWRITRSAMDLRPDTRIAKAQRDIRLAELEINESGERPQLLLAMGESWTALGEPLKAAGWFRQAIDSSAGPTTEHLEAYYGLLTTFDGRAEARDQQVAACLQALKAFPLDAQLLCAMGSYMQAQGRLDLACRSYQVAVEHGQINQAAWHLAGLVDVATICYSLTLELQGRTDEACKSLENALRLRGHSDRVRRQLLDLHVKHNRRQEALAEVDRWPGSMPHRDALRTAVRGACLAAQQQWPAAIPYLRRAYDAGCRQPICLRWLASALIALGDLEAAEPMLLRWQAAAPGHPEPQQLLALVAQAAARKAGGADHGDALAAPAWRIDASSASHSPADAPHVAAQHPDSEILAR